ncbi:MAG: TSUP family transporter, partial [Persicimonas sp.]
MFEHAWYIYLLVLAGGIFAGVVNTLAGSGSLVALAVLVFLGLPATVANGTNRVGVIVQCVVGLETFRRGGKLRPDKSAWYVVPA